MGPTQHLNYSEVSCRFD